MYDNNPTTIYHGDIERKTSLSIAIFVDTVLFGVAPDGGRSNTCDGSALGTCDGVATDTCDGGACCICNGGVFDNCDDGNELPRATRRL